MESNPVLNSIKARLWRRNQNWLAVICGQTGTGKSWSACSIAKIIDKSFTIDNVVFSATEFIELINSGKAKRGSVIVFDEAGVGFAARNWYSKFNKNLSYILQTFRHMNLGLIFTVPSFDFVDVHARRLFHAYIETHTINYKERYVRLKWQGLQYNAMTKTLYRKYPRVRGPDGKIRRIPYMDIYEPPDNIKNPYEAKKKSYLAMLNKEVEARIKAELNKGKHKGKTKKSIIKKAWEQGLTNKQIATEYNISLNYVKLQTNLLGGANKPQ